MSVAINHGSQLNVEGVTGVLLAAFADFIV
jgi:hypothetical protein